MSISGSGSGRGSSGKGGRGGSAPGAPCRREEGVAGPVLSPVSAAGCRIGRRTHASLQSRAAPQAGASTPGITILLEGVLGEGTRTGLEGCPSPRASGKGYWGIKVVLKWCQRAAMLLGLFREGLGGRVVEDLRPGRGFAARIFLLSGSWPAASLSSSSSPAFFCVAEQAQQGGRNTLSATTQCCVRHEPEKQHTCQALSSIPLLGHGWEALGLL